MVESPWKEDAEKAWHLLSWEGEAQWFGTKAEENGKRVMGGRLRSLDQLIGSIRNAEFLGWNLYLNANPSRATGKKKVSREDITHWRYVVVDMDPEEHDPTTYPLPSGGLENQSFLLNVGARVYSGRGVQFWVPVVDYYGKPVSLTMSALNVTPEPHLCESGMSGFLHKLGDEEGWADGWIVDTTCSDLPRVVRCPGSVNQKTGRRAKVELMPSGWVGMDLILEYARPPEPEPSQPIANPGNLLDVLAHLNVRSRRFLLEGVMSPGRHTACFACAKSLQELGVDKERAFEWLLIGSGKSVPQLPIREVARIVKQVYQL